MALSSTSRPGVTGRVLSRLPATLRAIGGIAVSKINGIWTIQPDFSALVSIDAPSLSDPTSKQVWVYDPVTREYNVITLAGLGDALYAATSTTSLSLGAGSKTFVTQSGKDLAVGSWLVAYSAADPTKYMLGQVTSYAGTTLVVNMTAFGGSGTKADWIIRASSPPGAAGKSAGYSYLWDTGTSAADPGAGKLRCNNAALASATALYISKTDNDGNALAAELATISAISSVVKGRLKIYDPLTPTNFVTFDVTGFTDSGSYDTLAFTPIQVGGSFTAGLPLRYQFTPKGDKGDPGPSGSVGTAGTPTANQFATFSNSTTIQGVSITGLVKGNGTSPPSAAVAGTDYQDADPQLSSLVRQNSQSAAYTLVLGDGGKHIYHPPSDTTARVWTIPANSAVAFPIGTAVTFDNDYGAGALTITINTDTLVLVGAAGSTGSRTLASGGQATAIKVSATRWRISGNGLT